VIDKNRNAQCVPVYDVYVPVCSTIPFTTLQRITASSFSFVIVKADPDEDAISVLGEDGPEARASPVCIAVSMPVVTFSWYDAELCKRVTQATMLLSGVESSNSSLVESRIDPSGMGTTLTMDIGNSLMYNPEAYNEGRYGSSHSKMVAMKLAVKKIKGDSMHNPVKCSHKERTCGIRVEKEFIDEGVRILKFGEPHNVQVCAHMEMKGIRSDRRWRVKR
jgi:hypothetical protein